MEHVGTAGDGIKRGFEVDAFYWGYICWKMHPFAVHLSEEVRIVKNVIRNKNKTHANGVAYFR